MLSPTWQQRVGVRHPQESGQKDEHSHQDVDQGVLPHLHAQRSPRWRCGSLIMVSPSPPPLPQFLSGLLQLCLHPLSSVPVQIHQQLCLCHLEMPHLGDRGHPISLWGCGQWWNLIPHHLCLSHLRDVGKVLLGKGHRALEENLLLWAHLLGMEGVKRMGRRLGNERGKGWEGVRMRRHGAQHGEHWPAGTGAGSGRRWYRPGRDLWDGEKKSEKSVRKKSSKIPKRVFLELYHFPSFQGFKLRQDPLFTQC